MPAGSIKESHMNGRKAAIGLAVLCALIVSAFAASSASADTAYKCQEQVSSAFQWKDEHCLNESTGGNTGKFAHVVIVKNTATPITGSNSKTEEGTTASSTAKLKGVAGGVETEIQCTTVGGSGSMENKEEGATMWAQGTGEINYSGCSVTKPAGKGCVVNSGKVNTKTLAASTKGLTKQLKFEPASGTEFASITIESCSVSGLNKTFPVTGSLIADTSGATTSSTHAAITAQNTLKFAGQKAGLEGAITLSGEDILAPLVTT
jgi:hypothetical protein